MMVFLSCEDVIQVDLPTSEPRLLIDANFSVFFNEVPSTMEGSVILKLSAPFYQEKLEPANNATVFITNMNDGSIYEFTENGDTGIYEPRDPLNLPNFNTQYELTVLYETETYKGNATLIPAVPIDEISQGDGTLFTGDETEVLVKFTDDASRDDYYLFDLDFDLYLPTEDRFYQGEQFVFSYFYEDIEPGKEVTITINGVDKQFYNYMNILIDQSGQNGGGPFESAPSTIRGNMVNITNPDKYPLGYFSLAEANRLSLVIE
ncbi:DUF4249 family protein [Flavobacteriaceae bacterium KMM 6897]|nr:DUF4249 family protein [Flavobacteriaceae bacterium KMM 6897]MEB8345719.1 DUF4249 family protein [Flavobacteriaceae bacterium KMM 6898]